MLDDSHERNVRVREEVVRDQVLQSRGERILADVGSSIVAAHGTQTADVGESLQRRIIEGGNTCQRRFELLPAEYEAARTNRDVGSVVAKVPAQRTARDALLEFDAQPARCVDLNARDHGAIVALVDRRVGLTHVAEEREVLVGDDGLRSRAAS